MIVQNQVITVYCDRCGKKADVDNIRYTPPFGAWLKVVDEVRIPCLPLACLDLLRDLPEGWNNINRFTICPDHDWEDLRRYSR